jgi:superfamily I DNA/RNA helicase
MTGGFISPPAVSESRRPSKIPEPRKTPGLKSICSEKPGLRVATMHRVKGLEFEHIVVVAANKGILPFDAAVDDAADGVARRDAETGERSLLYVALTRARRSAAITGYGEITPFINVP